MSVSPKKDSPHTLSRRIVYLDFLRIISMFAVMVIHIGATGYGSAGVGGYNWGICWSYTLLSRFAVPVFVMISGAMFLDPSRDMPFSRLLKQIKRILITFVFWSFCFALLESAKDASMLSLDYFRLVLEKTICGHYHMWFLYMIVGLYIATPFLRKISENKRLLQCFIVLSFLLHNCCALLKVIPATAGLVESVLHDMELPFFGGYAGCYCLGYYLFRYDIGKKRKRLLYGCAAAAMGTALLSSIAVGVLSKSAPLPMQEESMPYIFLYAAALFVFVKEHAGWFERNSVRKSSIVYLASLSFGMYLVHPAVNFVLRKVGVYALTFNPLVCVPLVSLGVCVISLGIIYVIRKVPVMRKVT